jgi:hypothetical protein
MNNLRRAFVASSIAWAVLLPLAPFAASQPAPARAWYALAFLVYGLGSFICHQLPARSFYSWSAQWPVCARCTGIYFGAAVTALITMTRTSRPIVAPASARPTPVDPSACSGSSGDVNARAILAVASLPTVLTLIYEWTTGATPSNGVRALAGAPLGAAVAFVVERTLVVHRTLSGRP